MPRLDPTARVRQHIEEFLAEGPIAFDALEEALIARGLDLGPHPDERLDDVLETMEGVDWLHVPDAGDLCFDRLAVIDGITWTVPIGEVDLASDTVPTDALGLLLFVALINEWCMLDGGGNIDIDVEGRRRDAAEALGGSSDGGITLPAGWLEEHGARAGGFLLVRLDGGVVQATGVDHAPGPSSALVAALAGAVDLEPPSRACRRAIDVLTEVFVLHPELRGAHVAPLDDWLEAAGLVEDRGYLARAGFDFERERLRRGVEQVASSQQFSDTETLAYAEVAVVWDEWLSGRSGIEPESLAAAALALGSPHVASAFVDEELDADAPDEMVAFGEALIEAVGGRHRAGPAWLVAQSLCVAGRTDRFETWVDTALGFDADHLLARHDKAWFEFDRGEARRAKALLSGMPTGAVGHDLAILDSVVAPARPTARRNDPCPCGSGRKYKQCHLGVDEVPLDARLTWLYRKANWWLERRHRPEVETMAWLRARDSGLSPGRLLESDALIADAVLTEGGRWEEWLVERGALLPSDEALLASQWALVDRSVYEVTAVRLDEGMTLRDVRTGEVVDVQERRGTHDLKVGWFVLVRPLPTGNDAHQFFGGITIVPDPMLARFIDLLDEDPTAAQLLQLVAGADAPPTMTNRDGHATVLCETAWRVADIEAAGAALDASFERSGSEPPDDPGRWTWLEDGEPDGADEPIGGRTVLGILALVGDLLTINTNSVERAEEVSRRIKDLLVDAEKVEDLRSSIEEIRDDLDYERAVLGEEAEPPSGPLDPGDYPPELWAALRQQMDRYEEQWVDESIPALGGLTPRQALDDPTRRDDLLRLLDRMEEMDAGLSPDQRALGMRTSRLRELLGLSTGKDLRLPGR